MELWHLHSEIDGTDMGSWAMLAIWSPRWVWHLLPRHAFRELGQRVGSSLKQIILGTAHNSVPSYWPDVPGACAESSSTSQMAFSVRGTAIKTGHGSRSPSLMRISC